MRKTQSPLTKTGDADSGVPVRLLPRLIESWLLAGDINRHSRRTLESRRERTGKLVWFLNHRETACCDLHALRQFFHYVSHGHTEPGGRWGNARMTKPTSPGRAKSYHSTLRTFFAWLVTEGEAAVSPMDRIPPPVDRPDQIQPFSDDQLKAMLAAAKRPARRPSERRGSPRRDEAILLLLLDTGIRASELCGIACGDVDLHAGHCTIRDGKGGKSRIVPFSRDTKRALYHYLNEREVEDGAPLFLSERGMTAGDGLTPNGLFQLVQRLGEVAKVEGVRCSPHTFRHTFAISFLRAGGNVFTLQQILGHTHLAMTQRYVAIAEADVMSQHRRFSPVERLKGGRGK